MNPSYSFISIFKPPPLSLYPPHCFVLRSITYSSGFQSVVSELIASVPLGNLLGMQILRLPGSETLGEAHCSLTRPPGENLRAADEHHNQIHQLKTLFHQLPLQLRHLEWFPIPYKIEFDPINYYLHFLCSSWTPYSLAFLSFHATPLPTLSILTHILCVSSSITQVLLLSPTQSFLLLNLFWSYILTCMV